ncbi:hypothetical protein FC65_GL001708 [Ligilactobacillus acidipiscis DSM 15836]|jgi:hypothetical protein|uniref:FeoB-associated Cys-rich membrane protein n=2 Tax=Ligilactobacillus acidipiscis TaxID=89059 RepID=A0A921FC73_9LACO|nr:FeoB-associated Cys-rich membrane protein [Ligilactobacillus acidipiscis]KRM31668.1 hypothetical protein FC65_GL001708 [Ligilactobacillus acidipiscis DSM 15836]WEV57011.1 FeoB-associated Cys-rich membrane protein [Ligilactobacillus acidipiscis]GAW63342.1 hypothetical protein Lacidipiscis_00525 [Ligilactobacillus acidipiscis]GEN20283.1 hypothetical protein LAC02_35640 [Ligilactobacillus acidipiscis]HJE97773.1 FeoB-associated Cys-rich membrane protein [Ligilactobacillus acidipiscis]
MIATIILGILIFGFFAYVVYKKFIKNHGAADCHSCDDIGCPLADAAKMNKKR